MTNAALRSKITRLLFYCSLSLFAFGLLIFSKETASAAFDSLLLCGRVLIPSLFPFMVVSSLAINSTAAQKIGKLFSKPMNFLFNVPGAAAPVFILGLIGGYPVGAANAIMLYKSGLCSKTEAERLLAFCNNCGPAFILGAVGASLFGGSNAGILLYVCHIASSVAVGLLFRFYKRLDTKVPEKPLTVTSSSEARSFSSLFTLSVKTGCGSVLNVCAYVIFFSVAVKLLYISGIIPAAAAFLSELLRPLAMSSDFAERLISGIFEMTGGVYGLAGSSAVLSSKLTAVAFMLSWAGLSVHFQVLDFMGDSGLSPKPYIIGKLLHGSLSAALVWAGTEIIPFDTKVSATVAGQISALWQASPVRILLLSAVSCAVTWALLWIMCPIFLRKGKEKIERRGKKSYNSK